MPANEQHVDVLIIGAGLGGCAAALAAIDAGCRVLMTEPTHWLGGQLTAQAVPPDENRWIETHTGTRRYLRLRELIRSYYRDHYPLTETARKDPRLNPGLGTVSGICAEPKVGHAAIEQLLAWPTSAGLLQVHRRTEPVAVDLGPDDTVRAVTLRNRDTDQRCTVSADYVLDATELGDLLPLAGAEYVTGAESQRDTGEPHAPDVANPDNVQALSWCFAMACDNRPGVDHTIDRPTQYERWRDYVMPVTPPWPGPLLSWTDAHPHTLEPRHNCLFAHEKHDAGPGKAFWNFRRILAAEHFPADRQPDEITLVNWPMIDFIEGNLIDQPADRVAQTFEDARQLSLSFFYWLQTEAPRGDGGTGYPQLYLRPDAMGTIDGLAIAPYIRESRRIRARFTVTENHVGVEARNNATTAARFHDSVGIGAYRIDLHPSTAGDNYIDIPSLPFQIPLGALLPVRLRNLLPACKNIGTTHITNGCYRLHPIEWNVGEAAGALAAYCLEHRTSPHAVHESADHLAAFQSALTHQGVTLHHPAQ